MRLGELVDGATPAGLDIHNVQIDSRACGPGSLFFAMPGETNAGAQFADDAVARGAVAVVATAPLTTNVPTIVVPAERLHDAMVTASARVCRHPERDVRLVGVTGTNGKTSVTTVLAAMWQSLGRPARTIGTLTHERTTPAPPELYRELALAREAAGISNESLVTLEVSSHALVQGRVDGLHFEVAVFTNLTLDHLDYHQSMEQYFEAKSHLFSPERCERAVVWVDDSYGRRLANFLSVPVREVQRSEATDVVVTVGSTSFEWRGHRVTMSLSGAYNVDNALVALSTASELGLSDEDAARAISHVPGVPGRMEVVRASDPTVIIDYAHTPDGLERLLRDTRELATGRLIVVFGCGGDRDRSKRAVMGEIATQYADLTVLTSDNPRHENPETILDEIERGCKAGTSWRRLTDRRAAIASALSDAGTGDVVVIAGKGHESTQTIGDVATPFDDRLIAAELVS